MLDFIKKIIPTILKSKSKQEAALPKNIDGISPSSLWLIKEVYAHIMDPIQASELFKTIIFSTFLDFRTSNADQRLFEKVAKNKLLNEEWVWPEFDHWFNIFKKDQQWPRNWTEYITKEPHEPPDGVKSSLSYLSVSEIKSFLKQNGAIPKPMPKKRMDWETALCERADWNILGPIVKTKYDAYKADYLTHRKIYKIKLLFFYLKQSVHGRMRYYQLQDMLKDETVMKIGRIKGLAARTMNDGLEIEKEFVKKFNMGLIKNFPPYFPGCSISVFAERYPRK